MTQQKIDLIQEKIGYRFNEQYLLVQAFTRKSFSEENYDNEDNEKLEFVGDRVIDLIVVKKQVQLFGFKEKKALKCVQFEKGRDFNFKFTHSESEMTEMKKSIVQTDSFAKAIEKLKLEQYLLMGRGDIKKNVQNEPRVKEDLFEAIIGAIAIDCCWNMEILEAVVEKMLNLENVLVNPIDEIDYVSWINNYCQKSFNSTPKYDFDDSGNEDVYQCYLDLTDYFDEGLFGGLGRSKKEADRNAAKKAYEFIQNLNRSTNAILDIIGNFDFDSAISKLQMLQEKKIISGLEYIFTEEAPTKETNGNPIWLCQCKIDGVDHFVELGSNTKMLSKKGAAFEMLKYLVTGRDDSLKLFLETGKIVEEK